MAKKKRVRFQVGRSDEVWSDSVAAFVFLDPAGRPLAKGASPPVEVPGDPPVPETVLSVNLGSGRRRRSLLLDLSGVPGSGPHRLIRAGRGEELPPVFYFDGPDVYSCARGSEVEVVRGKGGVQVSLDHCVMNLLNRHLDRESLAGKPGARGSVPVGLSIEQPVSPKQYRYDPGKVEAMLATVGQGPEERAADQGALSRRTRAADPAVCLYLAWQYQVHLQNAGALRLQWWNPWAQIAAFHELAMAYNALTAFLGAGCI